MKSVLRYVLLACGWLALGLGVAGIFLPVLPTTPFALLAAACFLKSSERLHRYVVEHPVFGRGVSDYLEGRGIRKRTKITAITMLWLSILASVIFWVPYPWLDILLILVASGTTVYLLRLPTSDADTLSEEKP